MLQFVITMLQFVITMLQFVITMLQCYNSLFVTVLYNNVTVFITMLQFL